MLMSTTEAAEELGITSRQVRRIVDSGYIQAERVAGRLVLYEKHVFAYKRANARGRLWSDSTRYAALDLLNGIDTHKISGSQKSRLKSRIRQTEINVLVRQILAHTASTYEVSAETPEIPSSLTHELELVGAHMKVLVTLDSRRVAARKRLVSNPNGRVVVIQGDKEHQQVLEALSLYTYGDSREREAAEKWIDNRRAKI